MLSCEQKSVLQNQLHAIDCSSHEGLLNRFTVVKVFVHDIHD